MIRALVLAAVLASADNERAMGMLRDWERAVDQHAGGERDAALAQIAAWTYDDAEMLRAYVEALIDLPIVDGRRNSPRRTRRRQISGNDLAAIRMRTTELQRRGDFDQFRKRAAMLHTDTALLASMPVVPDPSAPRSQGQRNEPAQAINVTSFDGRVEGFEVANPHWQYGRDVLESLPSKLQRDPLVAQWYRAIGAYYAEQHNYADAMRHFERARAIVPDDPGVLYGEACLQETLGSPPNQNFVRVTTLANGLIILGVSTPAVHYRRAESMLRQALAAQPYFIDAQLRLGRVLALLGQHRAALPHFQRVSTESRDPALIYYAHLFAGDAALALGRAQESRVSYERALELYPRAQAARLGLGAALRTLGDRAAALEMVLATLTVEARTRNSADEPWWEYYQCDAAHVERLLSELRAPFRGGRR